MATWTYLIGDLVTNQIIDELPMTNVRMSKVINGSGQFQGTVNLNDPQLAGRNVYDLTRPVRRVVYAVRDNSPFWGGIVWASDYDEATRSCDLGAADWWSYFDHRKVLPVLSAPPYGPYYVAGLSQLYTAAEQNDIARGLVSMAQTHTAGNIGITANPDNSGLLLTREWDGFEMKDVGEALRDLAGLFDGPDIAFDVGAFDANGRPARVMRIGTPSLTQQGDFHTWDLGGNLLSYLWSSGGGTMATRAFASGAGNDRGTLMTVSEDTTKYADGWPLLEIDDTFTELSNVADVQAHSDSDLDAGSLPTVQITLRVRGDRTPVVGEVDVGDQGTFVIQPGGAGVPGGSPLFPAGLAAAVRITSISVSVDDTGLETVEMTCYTVLESI